MRLRTRFRRLSDTERHEVINDIFGGATEYNRFYDAVAVTYRVAEFICLFAALLFGVIYIAVNAENIQYSQFEYLAQNFAYILEQNEERRTYITYEQDGDITALSYRGGLAICSDAHLSVYSATGVRTSYHTHGMAQPVTLAADKYLLVYDRGGSVYKLYSSFSEVHSGESEYRIHGACVGGDGSFALISSGGDSSYVVSLYNKSYKLINRYKTYSPVFSAAISDDGTKIAVASVSVGTGGRYETTVNFYTAGEDKLDGTIKAEGVLPLDCCFSEDGGFILLGDSTVLFYDENGRLLAKHTVAGYDMADISETGVVILSKNGGGRDGYLAQLFDSQGDVSFSGDLDGTPIDVEIEDGYGFVLTLDSVVRLGGAENGIGVIEVGGITSDASICVTDGDGGMVYICDAAHSFAVSVAASRADE